MPSRDDDTGFGRSNAVLSILSLAVFAVLLSASWKASPDRHDVAVILYIAAGVLEASGVGLTAIDVRAKQQAARDYVRSRPLPTSALRPTSVRDRIAEQAAAARGVLSYAHLNRIGIPLLAALDGRILAAAAALLLAGIGVGTAANILSAS